MNAFERELQTAEGDVKGMSTGEDVRVHLVVLDHRRYQLTVRWGCFRSPLLVGPLSLLALATRPTSTRYVFDAFI